MKLSEIIKKYRKEHDLSQRQMGARCGLSTGYISLIEKEINPQTGKLMVPSLPVMNKIAKGMNLTLDDLLAVCDNMDVNLSDKETIVSAPTAERDIDPIYDALNIAGGRPSAPMAVFSARRRNTAPPKSRPPRPRASSPCWALRSLPARRRRPAIFLYRTTPRPTRTPSSPSVSTATPWSRISPTAASPSA